MQMSLFLQDSEKGKTSNEEEKSSGKTPSLPKTAKMISSIQKAPRETPTRGRPSRAAAAKKDEVSSPSGRATRAAVKAEASPPPAKRRPGRPPAGEKEEEPKAGTKRALREPAKGKEVAAKKAREENGEEEEPEEEEGTQKTRGRGRPPKQAAPEAETPKRSPRVAAQQPVELEVAVEEEEEEEMEEGGEEEEEEPVPVIEAPRPPARGPKKKVIYDPNAKVEDMKEETLMMEAETADRLPVMHAIKRKVFMPPIEELLQEHPRNSFRQRPVNCLDCGERTANWNALVQHKRICSAKGSIKVYSCFICSEGFPTRQQLETHKSFEHPHLRGPRNANEPPPLMKFINEQAAKAKLEAKQMAQPRSRAKATIKAEQQGSDQSGRRVFTINICGGCNVVFGSVEELEKHNEQHHKKTEISRISFGQEGLKLMNKGEAASGPGSPQKVVVRTRVPGAQAQQGASKVFVSSSGEQDDNTESGKSQVVRVKVPGRKSLEIKQEGRTTATATVTSPDVASQDELVECPTCGKCFNSEETLKLHQAICQVR